MAVRTLGTCRILGKGFAMLRSVSHHLELAHCAFTPQSLDEQVALSVTRSGFRRYRALRGHWLTAADGSTLHAGVDTWQPPLCATLDACVASRSHDNCAAATVADARLLSRALRENIAHRLVLGPGTALKTLHGAAHCGTTPPPHRSRPSRLGGSSWCFVWGGSPSDASYLVN